MRYKLGIIVPSWNTTMEYETQRMATDGTSIHTMPISHTADTEENVIWMGTQVPSAAKLLAHAKVDVICYGCTGGGFIKGSGYDQDLTEQIEAATGITGNTTIVGVTDALRAFGAKALCVASPYEPWLNERLRDFLGRSGFEVLGIKGLGTQAHAAVKPKKSKPSSRASTSQTRRRSSSVARISERWISSSRSRRGSESPSSRATPLRCGR